MEGMQTLEGSGLDSFFEPKLKNKILDSANHFLVKKALSTALN
jgi:hypothetical protein